MANDTESVIERLRSLASSPKVRGQAARTLILEAALRLEALDVMLDNDKRALMLADLNGLIDGVQCKEPSNG